MESETGRNGRNGVGKVMEAAPGRSVEAPIATQKRRRIPGAARLIPRLRIELDQVDLGRQVRGDLEADFLLTNGGLGPGLHGSVSSITRATSARFHYPVLRREPRSTQIASS